MADNEKNMKVKIGAEDNTGSAFKSVGQNIQQLQGSTTSLASGLTKLGIAGAALYAGKELLSFFSDCTRLAIEDEDATFKLTAAINHLGQATMAPEINRFIESMIDLGQSTEETSRGLTRLMQSTGNVKESIYLSNLATMLAASGMGNYSGNVEALNSLLLGRTRSALATFGVEMQKDVDIVTALNIIEGKLTVTTDTWTENTANNLKKMQTHWDEFKAGIGQAFLKVFDKLYTEAQYFDWQTGKWTDTIQTHTEATKEETKAILEEGKAAVVATAQQKEASETQQEEADKAATSFKALSKNIVSSFNEQKKAIDNLRISISEIDDQLNDDLAKSEESYKNNVANIAKSAKQRIEDIEKQIEEEKSSMGQGWRTRISDLEAEKAKEQAILDKAGAENSNLADELNKDELDSLAETHAKEIQEIQDAAAEKKAEAQKEISDRTNFMTGAVGQVSAPGFYEKATGEETSFLGEIGAGSTQQSFVFNFNGAVAGDDGIKKIIQQMIDELNRQATLKGIGGK